LIHQSIRYYQRDVGLSLAAVETVHVGIFDGEWIHDIVLNPSAYAGIGQHTRCVGLAETMKPGRRFALRRLAGIKVGPAEVRRAAETLRGSTYGARPRTLLRNLWRRRFPGSQPPDHADPPAKIGPADGALLGGVICSTYVVHILEQLSSAPVFPLGSLPARLPGDFYASLEFEAVPMRFFKRHATAHFP